MSPSLNGICDYCIIEVCNINSPNVIIVTLYKPPDIDLSLFDQVFVKFLQCLTTKHKNKKIILAADWNIDFLKLNSNPKIDQFLNNMHSLGFLPLISVPTRITEASATLLDNFFVNFPSDDYQSYAIYEDISDHLPIFLNLKLQSQKPQISIPTEELPPKLIFSQGNFSAFQQKMAKEDWSFFTNNALTCLSPNDSYNLFLAKFKK